jgi:hypothetical protein
MCIKKYNQKFKKIRIEPELVRILFGGVVAELYVGW